MKNACIAGAGLGAVALIVFYYSIPFLIVRGVPDSVGRLRPVHIGRLGPVSASWLFSVIDGHAIGISRFEDQRVSLLVVRDCGTGADIISAADSKLFSKFTGEVIEVIWDTSASSS